MMPAVEATLTMLPPFSRRWGRAAWHIRKVPVRLTAMMRCQSSKEASTVWANLPMPATLHTTRGGPTWDAMSFIVVAHDARRSHLGRDVLHRRGDRIGIADVRGERCGP